MPDIPEGTVYEPGTPDPNAPTVGNPVVPNTEFESSHDEIAAFNQKVAAESAGTPINPAVGSSPPSETPGAPAGKPEPAPDPAEPVSTPDVETGSDEGGEADEGAAGI